MWVAWKPALAMKRSALRWVALPTPAEAKLIDPGLALAAATKACTVLNPLEGAMIITIGLRLGDRPGADGAAGAAAVLHDDRLLHLRGGLVEHHAGKNVGEAAGRERNNRADRLRREALRDGRGRTQRQTGDDD